MLGLYNAGEVPFKRVYIHGYVMAEDGSKMSKSVGNVVDPFPVIQEFGSDALRMGIIAGRTAAVNRGYDSRKIEEARNFCNKLWNVARFIEDKVGDSFKPKGKPDANTYADNWILSKLQQLTEMISSDLDEYRFAEAYEKLYHFVWDDFADWYVETSKLELNPEVLAHCLTTVLKLAHPFAPFLTETIWQTLAWEGDSLLAVSSWPEAVKADAKQAKTFEEIMVVVSEVRQLMSELSLSGTKLYYHDVQFLKDNAELVKKLTKLTAIQEVEAGLGLQLVQTPFQAWLDVDIDTINHHTRQLEKQKIEIMNQIKNLEGRLANANYVKQAPKAVVDQTKQQLEEANALLTKINDQQTRFTSR